jgi:hypothetical protein
MGGFLLWEGCTLGIFLGGGGVNSQCISQDIESIAKGGIGVMSGFVTPVNRQGGCVSGSGRLWSARER